MCAGLVTTTSARATSRSMRRRLNDRISDRIRALTSGSPFVFPCLALDLLLRHADALFVPVDLDRIVDARQDEEHHADVEYEPDGELP